MGTFHTGFCLRAGWGATFSLATLGENVTALVKPRFCVLELAGICIVLRTNKLKRNAVAHLLHRNVKVTSEEKKQPILKPLRIVENRQSALLQEVRSMRINLHPRALHLACFGQSQNLG